MSVDLREQDPAAATFNAVTQGVLFALIGCILGLVAAGLLVGSDQPLAWLIVLACMSAGAVPLIRWLRDRRRTDHLDLFGIDRSLRPELVAAATATDRIERSAASAPEGPIASLLGENHSSALAHLRLMEADARQAGPACRSENLRTVHHLEELAAASERLLSTALLAQPTVLNTLVERTLLVEQTLVEQTLVEQTLVEQTLLEQAPADQTPASNARSAEPDHADPGATSGH